MLCLQTQETMLTECTKENRFVAGNISRLEIIVFVKIVVDTHGCSAEETLDRGKCRLSVNRQDALAVEMALRTAEELRASVVICSMGVPSSESVLSRFLALGVAEVDLISDEVLRGADTYATARILVAYLHRRRPGALLCFFGTESSDSATAQVGPQVAALMKCRIVGDVVALKTAGGDRIRLYSRGGIYEMDVDVRLPLVVIVSGGAPPLRVATVNGVLAARAKSCQRVTAAELGLLGDRIGVGMSRTEVVRVRPARQTKRILKYVDVDPARFLLEKIAGVRHAGKAPSTLCQSCAALPCEYMLVSDFADACAVGECRRIAASFRNAGLAERLALCAVGPVGEVEMKSAGVGMVYRCSNHCRSFCDAVRCGMCLAKCLELLSPRVAVCRCSPFMRQVAPVAAALTASGLAADCTAIDFLPDGGVLFERPTFGESRMAMIRCCQNAFQMATLRGGRFCGEECVIADPKVVSLCQTCESDPDFRVCVKKQRMSALWSRDVVLVGGAGLTRAAYEALKDIANALGVDFGVTRPLVDRGWEERRFQIGQTGACVSHPLYVAFGVSGELEHRIAIGDSSEIVVVNHDAECPLARQGDWMIQTDANALIFALKESIMHRKE